MLQLTDIVKEYPVGDGTVTALNGVSLAFRDSEFVAILGQSGCGKTTLLNIIGGLDRYTSGDLKVNGQSTKDYSDADWDAYRNHEIGFVFQSYNLIPHQTVLANVELALTLSGVSPAERKARATEALEKVGLGDQLDKRPTMMSGGQMQRVAIARAIVNNPSIILADEPTGALDSKTSVQIMDLLQEIASDRLVIMVTHNPELAEQYATRIVKLSDGQVVSDSNPLTAAELAEIVPEAQPKQTHLPFVAALGLSANNLRTKKGRAFLTAFAGAIGIIGIALILSLSSGMNDYIHKLETDVMGDYPIEIDQTTVNMSTTGERAEYVEDATGGSSSSGSLLDEAEEAEDDDDTDPGKVTSNNLVARTYDMLESAMVYNDLGAFKDYIEAHESEIDPYVTAVTYSYTVNAQAWREDDDGNALLVSPTSLFESQGGYASTSLSLLGGLNSEWKQLTDSQTIRENHYTLEAGDWPQEADEVCLVVDEDGEISDYLLYVLGYLDIDTMNDIVEKAENDEEVTDDAVHTFSYEEMLGREYTVFSPSQLYQKDGDVYVDMSDDQDFMNQKMASGEGQTVKVVGVLRAKEAASYTGGMVYTGKLTHHLMEVAAEQDVVKAQLAAPDVNVLTGEEFSADTSSLADVDSYMMGNMSSMLSMAGEAGEMTRLGVAREGTAQLTADLAWGSTFGARQVDDETGPDASDDTGADTGSTDTDADDTTDDTTDDTGTTTPSLSDLQQAIVDAVDTLTPEQQQALLGLMEKVASGEGLTMDDIIDSGLLSQEQVDQLTTAVQDQVQQYVEQYVKDHQDELLQQYLGNVDTDALLQQYLGSIDTDALLQQYLGSIDTSALLSQYLNGIDTSALLQQLLASGAIDPASMLEDYLNGLSEEDLLALIGSGIDGSELEELMSSMSKAQSGTNTYDAVMEELGYATPDQPSAVTFYPVDFDGKQAVQDFIDQYNAQAPEDEQVTYTDLVGIMTRSITEIIDIITAVLVAFVSISLVVSSIMIAIITYISVLERTKEIGILRALGASKGDVTRIFNAETFIEGLLSGILGVVVTMVLNVPISQFIYDNYGAANIATLPWYDALMLIGISVVLTFIAGFIPARLAARKDPVEALRSE